MLGKKLMRIYYRKYIFTGSVFNLLRNEIVISFHMLEKYIKKFEKQLFVVVLILSNLQIYSAFMLYIEEKVSRKLYLKDYLFY